MPLRLFSAEPFEPSRGTDEGDDPRSIGDALRATLLFLAIIAFLAWAGTADAAAADPDRVTMAASPGG